jgi:exonuclease VII large subunit
MSDDTDDALTLDLFAAVEPPGRGDPPAAAEPDGPVVHTPTAFLEEVQRRLVSAFDGPVVVEGRVVGVRDARGWVTLTLGDAEPQGRYPTRLSVSLNPGVARRVVREALVEQTLVQVTGTVRLWVNRAEVQLQGTEVVRVGHSQTQATYDAAVVAVEAERLGQARPGLPLFLRRVLLLAPIGTTLGDLTRDLGGWQPPEIVHRSIPGDSPDLHRLVDQACTDVPDVDVVVLARGGAIEAISGWDDVDLLRCIDRRQRGGTPFLVAVGHADHTPLVYRVGAYTVRHTAEAGRWLADHNRTAADRIEALDRVPELLRTLLGRQDERLAVVERQARLAVSAHLGRQETRLDVAARSASTALRSRVRAAADRVDERERRLHQALRQRVADRRRRVELVAATLDGFRTGIALISRPDGSRARIEPGERIVIEVADATATATIEQVTRHTLPAIAGDGVGSARTARPDGGDHPSDDDPKDRP